ncbi:Rhodanese-like (plasmid) [Pseudorhizobium banfieldiae]|uniref:Rhodanese-like n=1 Tax=Pseudorhizobium banfieldiae TaxID=1125847 RepID=L0NM60_9HYPH|nr:rhodanese-like domain-containing protein [Pseudorhizobium banfieldiae]CAD6631303.1 rhodanese-like domain-containing protein [arsenite-oxidising bacterium NT-25]CCF22135.1 Rhodanese-like [Pseudorhizobium banfieldiae]HZG27925.1 rhodanese-like domain-containing protein [Ensifer sp.]
MNETVKKELAEASEVCPTTTRGLLAKGALLVDVREQNEVDQVAFADCEVLHIPMSEFEQRWREVPRDREVIVACAVGARSLKATYYLMYQGYGHVANMKHGMARWLERGFPVSGDVSEQPVKAGSACGCGDEGSQSAGSCCSDKPTDPKSESGCGASNAAGSCC